jgi:hypothetical protein
LLGLSPHRFFFGALNEVAWAKAKEARAFAGAANSAAAAAEAAVTPQRVFASSTLSLDAFRGGSGGGAMSAPAPEAWGVAAVAAAVGTYELDGEAHGFPKYKQVDADLSADRATNGASITLSSSNNSAAVVDVEPSGAAEGSSSSSSSSSSNINNNNHSDNSDNHSDRAVEHESLYLYRSLTGRWTVARGLARVAASKGSVVSTWTGASPVGLDFCYFNGTRGGSWPLDPTFKVADTSTHTTSRKGSSLSRQD